MEYTITTTSPVMGWQRITPGAYRLLALSWRRWLLSQNRSPQTLHVYGHALSDLWCYLQEQSAPSEPATIRREDLESYFGDRLATRAPATVKVYHAALRAWFSWLVEEREVPTSPMRRIRAPQVPEAPPPVLTEAQQRALLATCAGKDFADRRDRAILRLLMDTGMRRSEIAGVRLADVNLDLQTISIVGKGSRPRDVAFGKKALAEIDRYLRSRDRHPFRESEALWLGHKGGLSGAGIYQIVRRRGQAAGIADLWPHLFRHTFANDWLVGGGQEMDLMRLGGWATHQMMGRYGRSAEAQRARAAHKRLSPGDRV